MISNVLQQIKNRLSQEVQFRIGHKTLIKINGEWVEFDAKDFSLADWEDLKDLCLQGNEKIILETKGFVQGVFSDPVQSWAFSFTEWKDCVRAHFSFLQSESVSSNIQFSAYYDCLKKKGGLHLIAGQKKNGKSSLLAEIITEGRKYSPELIAIHAPPSNLTAQSAMVNSDSVVQLGTESLPWDGQHAIYDGIDTIIVDMNDIKDLNKWIRFAEEGRTVYLSLSAGSIENVLLQIKSMTENQPTLWTRFCDQLSSVILQKLASGFNVAVHEIWILKNEDRKNISHKFHSDSFQTFIGQTNLYQSLNQSILQSLVRRRFDVKKAFELSNDIESLDQSLKKMGL